MSDKKIPEPMDATAPERQSSGEAPVSRQRPCWAVATLVAEVSDLFPETSHEVGGYNGRDVGLKVTFTSTEEGLEELLTLAVSDARVDFVHHHVQEGHVDVVFHNRPRIYDLREKFGLAEAWSILEDTIDSGESDWEGGTAIDTTPDIRDGGGA